MLTFRDGSVRMTRRPPKNVFYFELPSEFRPKIMGVPMGSVGPLMGVPMGSVGTLMGVPMGSVGTLMGVPMGSVGTLMGDP